MTRLLFTLLAVAMAGISLSAHGQEAAATPPAAEVPQAAALQDAARDPLQLLDSLEMRRKELDERAKWLDLREEELKRLEEKLAKRIASLESLRVMIIKDLDKEKDIDREKIGRLAKIFSGMKPKLAAERLKDLDRETAIKMLKMMPEKVTAKILGKMNKRDAVELADALGIPISDGRKGER